MTELQNTRSGLPASHQASDRSGGAPVPWSVDPASGRLDGARWQPSPNYDGRPDSEAPSLLVIHAISLPPDQFGGPYIDALFANRLDPDAHPYFAGIATLRVSSHLCIFRDGAVTQYVTFGDRAWHAGESRWRSRARCNDFSIGIELEGSDHQVFDDRQYATLAGVVRALLTAYPTLSADAIAGHSDIAPGRKTDPGPCFDWPRFRAALAAEAS